MGLMSGEGQGQVDISDYSKYTGVQKLFSSSVTGLLMMMFQNDYPSSCTANNVKTFFSERHVNLKTLKGPDLSLFENL